MQALELNRTSIRVVFLFQPELIKAHTPKYPAWVHGYLTIIQTCECDDKKVPSKRQFKESVPILSCGETSNLVLRNFKNAVGQVDDLFDGEIFQSRTDLIDHSLRQAFFVSRVDIDARGCKESLFKIGN